MRMLLPATCCAIRAASNEVTAELVAPIFVGVTLYDPARRSRLAGSCLPNLSQLKHSASQPPSTVHLEQNRRGGLPITLP